MSRLDAAFFLSETPIAKEVTLADGSVHTFHFRDLPAARWRQYYDERDEDADATKANARLIADCVCMEDGGDALTAEEAVRLKAPVVTALVRGCVDTNGLTKKEKNV